MKQLCINIQELFKNRLVKFGVFVSISLLSVFVLLRMAFSSKDGIANFPTQINVIPLIITFPLFIAASILTAIVWGKMMSSLGCDLPMWQHVEIYIITAFVGRLPGGLWNVLGRIAWYNGLGVSKRVTAIASGLQWFMVLWSGAIVTMLILPWFFTLSFQNLLLIAGPILILALLFHPRAIKFFLSRLLKDFSIREIRFHSIFSWLLIYLLIWMMGGTILFLVILSLYPRGILWFASVAAWSLGNITGTVVTLLPSGFGLTEVVTSFLLAGQIPASVGVAATLLIRVLLTLYEMILSGIFYLHARKRSFRGNLIN